MPTQTGTIWAQWVGYTIADDSIQTYTVEPNHRDITAEAAIAMMSTGNGAHYSETGISQIVANGINEEFDPPLPRIQRSDVTQITFRTAAAGNCIIRGRHVIYYWE